MRVWRLPALIALPAAVAAVAVLAPELSPTVELSDPAAAEQAETGPNDSVALDGTATWFCPGVVGDHQVSLANLGDEPIEATVRIADSTGPEVLETVRIGSGSVEAFAVNEVGIAGGPSAMIEVDRPGLVVTHTLDDEGSPARANCGTHASARWYVAGGDTSDGANDNIVFYNPFPADAVVEVEFITRSGTRADSAEVLVRGRRTARLSTILEVPLESVVAIDARVVSGNVVAQRVARSSRLRTGASMTLASDAPAVSWAFPTDAPDEVSERYVIYNPTDEEAAIDIDVLFDDVEGEDNERIQVEPFQIDLFPNSVEVIDLAEMDSDRLPRDRPHTVVVRSVNNVAVLVDQNIGGVNGAGLVVSPGQTAAASSWIHTIVDDNTQLLVQNPGDETTEVRFVDPTGAADWHNHMVEVRPRTRQVIELDGIEAGQIVRIDADASVITADRSRSLSDEGLDFDKIAGRPGVMVAGTVNPVPGGEL